MRTSSSHDGQWPVSCSVRIGMFFGVLYEAMYRVTVGILTAIPVVENERKKIPNTCKLIINSNIKHNGSQKSKHSMSYGVPLFLSHSSPNAIFVIICPWKRYATVCVIFFLRLVFGHFSFSRCISKAKKNKYQKHKKREKEAMYMIHKKAMLENVMLFVL